MSNGDRWRLPDGREGLEVNTDGPRLQLAPIVPNWPFPGIPEWHLRKDCKRMPSKYLHETAEDAPW